MSSTRHQDSSLHRPLRLWPGIVLAVVTAVAVYVVPRLAPDAEIASLPLGMLTVITGALGGILIALWWLLFSRAPWRERAGIVALMVVVLLGTRLFVDLSIARAGMGMMYYFSALPLIGIALTAAAVLARHRTSAARQMILALAIVLACTPWLVVRTAGVIGGGGMQWHWRWTPTPEERLLARATDEPLARTPSASDPTPVPGPAGEASVATAPASGASPAPVSVPTPTGVAPAEVPVPARPGEAATGSPTTDPRRAPAESSAANDRRDVRVEGLGMSDPRGMRVEWPGFRGPHRDGVIPGVMVATDWSTTPPAEMWRRPVGPGWSSFAVQGDLLYTQEQRGEDEIVACYRVSTGQPVWRHSDRVRFWESEGGAGPRATPTLHGGRVYAFGATGLLNALDARTGRRIWSRDVSAETGRRIPDWGFASSPLVVDNLVVVAAAGTLAAYDLVSGEPRWRGPSYGGSYSSPHLATLDGVRQIIQLGGPGAISVSPVDGAVLWEHKWEPGAIVQPALTGDGDLVINTLSAAGGMGTRRLAATHGPDGWRLVERWTSNGLKPYFNDFVIHKGHAFGFDGSILSSINLTDGARNWKGGRYGNGQMILLSDQDVLLVISEDGELALVSATTAGYRELARFPALNGKTWNHPVLVGDVLLVRNGEEMAAFRLALAGRETTR